MHHTKFSRGNLLIMLCTLLLCIAAYIGCPTKAEEAKAKSLTQKIDKQSNKNTGKVLIKPAESKTKEVSSANAMSMLPPSRGVISSKFGIRSGKSHEGVDIAAELGTPIKAALDGKVMYSGWMEGYGNLIELQHQGEVVTRYGHCSKLMVSVGQNVNKGEVIGLVGSTGRSTGPHLHFEVRIKGVPVDPQGYVALGS